MNTKYFLLTDKIDSMGYETVYLEKPISNLIDFDWKNILDAPPKNSSEKTIQELQLISRSTQNRSKKDIELIHNVDQNLDDPFILLLEKYRLKYPQNYIDLFYDMIEQVLLNTKNYWNRPRPNQLAQYFNLKINVIVTETHHTAAYPSGHTVYSNLVANIIKDIYPQIETKELTNIVLETAKARVLQGVHFPSDNKASMIFSDFLFKKLNLKLKAYYNE